MSKPIALAGIICFLLIGLTLVQKGAESAPLPVGATGDAKAHVSPPEPVFTPDPDYPSSLRIGKHKSDTVELWLKVDDRGNVLNAHVVRSSDKRLNQNAIDAVKRWRVKPATKDGRPIGVSINVQVNYQLY